MMIDVLLRLHERLGLLFMPAVSLPIANLDLVRHHSVDLFNKDVKDAEQPLAYRNPWTGDSIGHDVNLFGWLASLLVGEQIARRSSDWLDYKAFSANATHSPEPKFTRRNLAATDEDDSFYVQLCVERWCADGVKEYFEAKNRKRVFRRSLIVGFVSEFDQYASLGFSGHQITVAFEIEKDMFKLFVIEYRMHEYVYNVHGRLFQYMANAIRSTGRFDERVHLITNRVVCLKGRMRLDPEFMMCMSISYRVSVMLSYVEDPERMREEDGEFEQSHRFLMHHTFTMLNWFLTNEDVMRKRVTVLVSKEMAEDVYEMRRDSHFVIVPFRTPNRDLERRIWYDVDRQTFSYSPVEENCLEMIVYSAVH